MTKKTQKTQYVWCMWHVISQQNSSERLAKPFNQLNKSHNADAAAGQVIATVPQTKRKRTLSNFSVFIEKEFEYEG